VSFHPYLLCFFLVLKARIHNSDGSQYSTSSVYIKFRKGCLMQGFCEKEGRAFGKTRNLEGRKP
jgi:hypothetical protein